MTKFSAYLNLFDDWDILQPALASIIDRVDEVIIIDGAYEWMTPYFAKAGRDPARSLPQVYDVLSRFGSKIKIVNGVWKNEVEKRIAGFEACSGRFRYRCDADEIFFFDEAACTAFFASGRPVGEMSMPIYAAPGLIGGSVGATLPRQCFLFDSDRISAREHLGYLWLVLPEWERKTFGTAQSNLIFNQPLAFNAHLTHWRPPSSSLSRARFYTMNYFRECGAPPWASDTPGQPITDFAPLFERISPQDFDGIMLGRSFLVIPAANELQCCATPLTPEQDHSFAPLYHTFLASLTALNYRLLDEWRSIVRGEDYLLDATLPRSLPVDEENRLTIISSEPIAAMKLKIASYFRDPSLNTTGQLQIGGGTSAAQITLPPLPSDGSLLRRTLSVAIWSIPGSEVLKFRLQTKSA